MAQLLSSCQDLMPVSSEVLAKTLQVGAGQLVHTDWQRVSWSTLSGSGSAAACACGPVCRGTQAVRCTRTHIYCKDPSPGLYLQAYILATGMTSWPSQP